MKNIILSSITGFTPPYEIYVCDFLGNNCQFIQIINDTVPPIIVFPLPDFFENAPAVNVKIIGVNSNCIREENVICSYFGNIFHTFCDCSNLSECIYTETDPNLTVGEVVLISGYDRCWQYSGYQFTNETSQDISIIENFDSCQSCFDVVAPTYFSACCTNYTFTFDPLFQSTYFQPNNSWYVNIPPSTIGTGTGFTGCTVIVNNFQTPDQTYHQSDWNFTTNTNISVIYPFPEMKKCIDCTEINNCP
jgi:hypothetical protein